MAENPYKSPGIQASTPPPALAAGLVDAALWQRMAAAMVDTAVLLPFSVLLRRSPWFPVVDPKTLIDAFLLDRPRSRPCGCPSRWPPAGWP